MNQIRKRRGEFQTNDIILKPSFQPPKPSSIHFASPVFKAQLILKASFCNSIQSSNSSISTNTTTSLVRGTIKGPINPQNNINLSKNASNLTRMSQQSMNSNSSLQPSLSTSSTTSTTSLSALSTSLSYSRSSSTSSTASSQQFDLFDGEIKVDSGSLLFPPPSSTTTSSSTSSATSTTLSTLQNQKQQKQLHAIFNPPSEPKKKETKHKSKQDNNNDKDNKDDNNNPPKPKKTRKTTATSTPSSTPPPSSSSSSTNTTSSSVSAPPTAEDFKGIETFCRNAGSSKESLQALVRKCSESESIAIVFFWPDGNSSHANTSTKLCTPSRPCGIWNCFCDRNLRSDLTKSPLLGALICLGNDIVHPYFLPLDSSGVESIGWSTLESILLLPSSSKVIYHTQIVWFLITHYLQSTSPHKYKNLFDPRIVTYLCDSTSSEQDLELNNICARFSVSPQKRPARVQMGRIALQCVGLYEDLQCLIQLHQILKQKLQAEHSLHVFERLEMPLSCLLSRMEYEGLVVSLSTLEEMFNRLSSESKAVEVEAHQLVQQDFNLSSPEQVAHILYDVLHLSPTANSSSTTGTAGGATAAGAPKKHASTSEDTLIHLTDQHPIVELILQHRHMTKIVSTFIEGIRPFVNSFSENESRVHACWNQTTVRTGRLSCSKPNLQNIPNERTVRNIFINPRSIFCASTGSVLISADYSQIEMRILAHVCGDESMRRLFRQSGDIYLTLAGLIFDKSPDLVSKTERDRAKTICLGVMYGMGLQAVATKLSIDVNTASSIMQSFYKKFPTVKNWIKKTKSDALQTGYVSTIMGRRRHLPDIQSSNSAKRSQAERQAVNSIIQGTASDIIKYAMLCVEEEIDTLSLSGHARAVMQIHDELIYEVHESIQESFVKIIKRCMEDKVQTGLNISVPLMTNVNIGMNWGAMFIYEGEHINYNVTQIGNDNDGGGGVNNNNNSGSGNSNEVKKESPSKRRRQND